MNLSSPVYYHPQGGLDGPVEIINGKKAITADTALQLEAVMPEIPARFWLNLESDYQLTKALIKRGRLRNRPP